MLAGSPFAWLSAVCAALIVIGCGMRTIDAGDLEDELKPSIEEEWGLKVKSVKCPDGRELRKGDTFDCTVVSTAGEKAVLKVTQTDAQGHFSYRFEG